MMILRSRWWNAALAVFILVNVAGAGFALAMGEQRHAITHLWLFAAGLAAYGVLRFFQRGRQQPVLTDRSGTLPAEQRLDYLQQSVDAIALEVERLGETQRYRDKLRSEQSEAPPPKKPSEP
jgi:hypothetical protein